MAVSKRVVLESLTKPQVAEIARRVGVSASGLTKSELVAELAGGREPSLEEILGELSRADLKGACRAAGLEDRGKEKAVLIERLLAASARGSPSSVSPPAAAAPEAASAPVAWQQVSDESGARLDRDLQVHDITRLTSVDALAAFLHDLGYPTHGRTTLNPRGVGLPSGGPAIRQMELLSEDSPYLQVIFVQLHSVTAKARSDLVRAFGKGSVADRLLILTSDFDTLEFVLIEKETGAAASKGKSPTTKLRSRVFVVPRRWPQQMLRILRRLTFTMDDGLRQYDKLRGVFDAAHFSGTYFINRALFSDHYLETRLKEDPAWSAISPGPAFESVRRFLDTRDRLQAQPLAAVCQEFYDPLWSVLGFRAKRVDRKPGEVAVDYELRDSDDERRSAALVYPWGRWLDGPDPNDPDRPTENPGSAVVSLLESGVADWVIVTNGRLWRLYCKSAHSRSTNFYEVDLPDVLIASGLSDPNEAFRYWWLFFRVQAFLPTEDDAEKCWLDTVVQGSREYASEVEEELKRRVFYDVVPALAHGFLHDRRARIKETRKPTEAELEQVRQGTLTLLYRLLFLLYAESRDLLPVREAEYYKLSLKSLKEEVAAKAGVAESEADGKLGLEFKKSSTAIYDRLADPEHGLFAALANGRSSANVPRYNGGLFRLDPEEASDDHEREIAEFLNTHKVPDRFLAAAIDRLARVEDSRTYQLAFVDYKSLGVRQLGSIYEGLLEFKLRIAEEDLAVTDRKKLGDWISLDRTRSGRRRQTVREVHKGDPYLVRDKSERKATGSYYTPDHIVEYIVENTVGPVLRRKTEALRGKLREAEKAYHLQLSNARANPSVLLGHPAGDSLRARRKADPTAKPGGTDFRAYAAYQAFHENDEHKKLVEELFDLKVLDPAMGSGHFLVEAVDFVTDELLHFLNAFPVNPVALALDRTREAILTSLREQGIETDEYLRRQLTDVHLLKRHVLKRCIYGVDLNPLATELAKVSLWLDAFTLGAPLSFLDHHLRTGNSLIGSSVAELEAAVEGQLFKIDESHLLRAVQSVLLVSRLADATASEVAESKRAFDEARRTLASYRILLDILVAKHFGYEKAVPVLMEMAPGLDPSSGETLVRSFREKVREEKLTTVKADSLDRIEELGTAHKFFHWDLEFPEVFYEFLGMGGGRIQRRAAGESGFDAVVGNPPYDEVSKAAGFHPREKAYLDHPDTYGAFKSGRVNLYRLFVLRGTGLLRGRGGRCSYIVPLGLFSDSFSFKTREALFERCTLHAIEAFPQKDDPERRVFAEAKLPTAIFVVSRKDAEATEDSARVRSYPGRYFEPPSSDLTISASDVSTLFPTTLAVPLVSARDLQLIRQYFGQQAGPRLSSIASVFAGEVCDNAQGKVYLSDDPIGPLVLRGAHLDRYELRSQSSQGESRYLNEAAFRTRGGPRAAHNSRPRVAFQKGAALDNWRRLIACYIPAGQYLFDTTGYMVSEGCDLYLLLALLNSSLWEYRFRCTSQTNHINAYELEPLRVPDVLVDASSEHAVELASLAKRAQQSETGVLRSSAQEYETATIDQRIDQLIFDAYQVARADREYVLKSLGCTI